MKITRRKLRKLVAESWAHVSAKEGDVYKNTQTGELVSILHMWEYPAEDDRREIVYYRILRLKDADQFNIKARHFHNQYFDAGCN